MRTASIPVRGASVEVCAGECGARCCRAPANFTIDRAELERVAALARARGIERWMARPLDGSPGWFIVRHGEQPDGVCPFLDQGTNLCGIYDERPSACRKFPESPQAGCLVWPA